MKKSKEDPKDGKILIPKVFQREKRAEVESDEKVNSRGIRARCVLNFLGHSSENIFTENHRYSFGACCIKK